MQKFINFSNNIDRSKSLSCFHSQTMNQKIEENKLNIKYNKESSSDSEIQSQNVCCR